jgi:propanol-preferring alcohol dehydrogenase
VFQWSIFYFSSDLHGWKGEFPTEMPLKYPIVGGHEGAGVVVKIGAGVTNLIPGDRVGVKACL